MTSLRRKTSTLLLAVYILGIAKSQAQYFITYPPSNTTTALGTNATFSCRGNGEIIWEISNTQIQEPSQLNHFAAVGVYTSLPKRNFSELFMTGTTGNNVTRTIQCLVADPNNPLVAIKMSEVVRLFVYAEPYPPSDLVIEVDGLNLVVTWTEPFSLQGEEISYVVSITNMATRENRQFIVNTTSYVFTEPFANCEQYEFTIFSMNGYSKSMNGISGRHFIPTEPLVITSSDVSINVSLTDSNVNVSLNITSPDPCTPAYPVTDLTINITEQETNMSITSISYDRVDLTVPYLTVSLDSDDGLVHYQMYTIVIEAENMIGSTVSENITLYTTGLQSVTAVMQENGSITVTCTFATGASSTGCQVTIFNTDNTQVEILSENITRQYGNTQATDTLDLLPDYNHVEDLLIGAMEILGSGEIGDITITAEVNLPQVTTTTEMPIAPSLSPDGSNTTLIAAVSGIAVVLVVLIVLIVILVVVIVHRRLKSKGFSSFAAENNAYSSTLTGSAIIERLAPNTEDTPMSLHNPGYTGEMAGNEPGVQASYAEVRETQLIAQNRVAAMEYDSVVPLPTLSQNSRPGHGAVGMGDRETQGQATSQNYQQNRNLENMSDVLYDTCRTGARVAIGGINIRQPSSAAKNAPNEQSFEPGSVQYDSLQVVKVATGPAEGYSVLNWDSDSQRQRPIPDRVVGYETLRGGDTDRNDIVVLQDNMSYGELTPNETVSESSSDSDSERSPLPNLSGSTQQQYQQELYSRTSHVNSAQHTVVPTDPVTGYSTMMRDEAKRSSGSGAIPAYDVVNLKAKRTHIMTSTLNSSAVKEEEKYAVAYEGGITRNPLYQATDTFPDETRTVKSTLNKPSGPNFTVLAPPDTQYVNTVTVPTNPDTGYSNMIREKAPESHTGPVPGYSTLQRKDETFTETERSCVEEKEVKNSINHSEGTEQDSRAEMSQLSDSG